MVRLDFKAAVVGPEVDGDADAGDAALVDLHKLALSNMLPDDIAYHFCCLRSCNTKLHVCISLPETVEQRVSREETVVRLPGRGDCLWARVAVQTTLLRLGGADQFFPVLELLRVRGLHCICQHAIYNTRIEI